MVMTRQRNEESPVPGCAVSVTVNVSFQARRIKSADHGWFNHRLRWGIFRHTEAVPPPQSFQLQPDLHPPWLHGADNAPHQWRGQPPRIQAKLIKITEDHFLCVEHVSSFALSLFLCLGKVCHEAKLSSHLAAKHLHDDRVAQFGKFLMLSPCCPVFWQKQSQKRLQTILSHDWPLGLSSLS